MPEGPEVKLFVDKIKQNFQGKTIDYVQIESGRYQKKPFDVSVFKNKNLKSVNCKGKFIWFDFEGIIMFNTLGMTGSWSKNKTKYTRLTFYFLDNEKLYFNDMRNFGTVHVKSNSDLVKKLKTIGPDMLSKPPSLKEFTSRLRKHNLKNVCVVLMNQKVISGVGNYIKAESLWYSRINPHSLIKDLTETNIETLYKAVLFVIRKSYVAQGASIKDYYTFDQEQGNAVSGFVVYGRKKDYNGHDVLKEQTLDKRTTHWVKERQTTGV